MYENFAKGQLKIIQTIIQIKKLRPKITQEL